MVKILAYVMHFSMVMAHHSRLVTRLFRFSNTLMVKHWVSLYQSKGLDSWRKFWIPVFAEWGRIRAPYLAKKMNINPQDPRSLGSYHDFEDPIFGITGHWETNDKGESVRVEAQCVGCDLFLAATDDKQCHSDFCRHMVMALEQNTGQTLNNDYQVEIVTLLTEGDTDCRFIHKLQK
ncbi:MAG: hypothetical protein ACR2PT_09495 [Endozoicomonas sp.]